MSGVSTRYDHHRAIPASIAKLLALSTILWIAGVLTIRLAAPFGIFGLRFSIELLPMTVPLAWATVDLARSIAGRMPLLEATAVACIPALLLDGVALTWLPQLYGPAGMALRAPAAWLLWFVGVSLAVALWRQMRHIAAVD